jgi:hypothetical protein
MRSRPRGKQRGLVFLNLEDKRGDALWWAWSEPGSLVIFRALDEPWQDDRHEECDDGESNQCHATNTPNLSCQVVVGLSFCRCIETEVDLADPGRAVE